ncbi:hypothetical protein ACQ4M3_07555 [Leptolyngbya sp. AN03gr2]|uniref:hypothetical protein n=1 Tax=Leptolyngbya sp. AN10 TaxID=3423365 RepID=UPI003D31D48F
MNQSLWWHYYQRCLLNQFDSVPTSLLEWRKPEEYTALIQRWAQPMRQRVQIQRTSLTWANDVCRRFHYLKTGVSGYASPFAYQIMFDQMVVGVIIVGTPFARKLKGEYGEGERCSCWEVLQVFRFWLIPQMQNQSLQDSKGQKHTLAIGSCAMGKLMRKIEVDWLRHHPPRNLEQPYRIQKVLTYSDPNIHTGTLYRSSGFRHQASNCGKHKHLDRWIYDIPPTHDPLPHLYVEQPSLIEAQSFNRPAKKLNRSYSKKVALDRVNTGQQLRLI